MIKAVIFDMDGLLVDSEPLWAMVYKEVFSEQFGLTISDEDNYANKGRRQNESIARIFRQYDLKNPSAEEIEKLIVRHMVRAMKDEAELMPGVESTLDILHNEGLPLAIASSSPVVIIKAVVNKFKLRDHFNHIYSAQYEPYGKPNPGVFISVAEKMSVPPHDCLVFEDAPNGVLAAKAADMHCIAIPDNSLKDHNYIGIADVVLPSLEKFSADMLVNL